MILTRIYGAVSFLLTFILSSESRAQNLIPNPGFEEFENYKVVKGDTVCETCCVKNWVSNFVGTADYYHEKNPDPVLIHRPEEECKTKSIMKFSQTRGGAGSAGIGIFQLGDRHREYLHIKLTKRLEKNHIYLLSFYCKVDLYSSYYFTTSSIGGFFSKGIPQSLVFLLKTEPQIKNIESNFISSTRWTQVQDTFIAKGHEEYLTIGNFTPEKNYKRKRIIDTIYSTKVMSESLYVILDDVSLYDVSPRTKNQDLTNGIKPALKNIYFSFNSDSLESVSIATLNDLAKILKRNSSAILLTGHTDNVGDEQTNINLSISRAKAVKKYLLQMGIKEERIIVHGEGSTKPVFSNNTNEGRLKNRRVEIKFF